MNFISLKNLLLVSTLGALAVGCSSVRVVKLSKQGGELALLGDREEAMEKAQAEMAAKCGGQDKFDIVEQGEVVVGEVSKSSTRSSSRRGKRKTRGFSSSSTVTRDKTEWRVIFECVTDEETTTAKRHTVSIPMAL
jgi:hypothetical protein